MGIVKASDEAIRAAAEHLQAGRLVAFPTETVYGLGADAANGKAVAAIFATKGAPRFNPLIVHVTDVGQAGEHAELTVLARRLIDDVLAGAADTCPGAARRVAHIRSRHRRPDDACRACARPSGGACVASGDRPSARRTFGQPVGARQPDASRTRSGGSGRCGRR